MIGRIRFSRYRQMQVEELAEPGEFDELRVPLDAATLPGVF